MLPLLASGQFEKFRLSLSSTDRVQRFRDEVDTLSEAAVSLSLQLEKLEQEVSTRTTMLIEQKNALSKERDFVGNLLDTAQAIVLTQNSDGAIISLNAYGEMLTRYTAVSYTHLRAHETELALECRLLLETKNMYDIR